MPQTFIYAIAFIICETACFFFPQTSRITTVLSDICLLGIVVFGIGETYLDIKKTRRAKASVNHADSSAAPRP